MVLQDARSEYQILPSGKDVGTECGETDPQYLKELVPLKRSLISDYDRCLSDASAFKGRSFRVGWGPGWNLIHSGSLISSKKISDNDDDADTEAEQPPSILFRGMSSASTKKSKKLQSSRYILKLFY